MWQCCISKSIKNREDWNGGPYIVLFITQPPLQSSQKSMVSLVNIFRSIKYPYERKWNLTSCLTPHTINFKRSISLLTCENQKSLSIYFKMRICSWLWEKEIFFKRNVFNHIRKKLDSIKTELLLTKIPLSEKVNANRIRSLQYIYSTRDLLIHDTNNLSS